MQWSDERMSTNKRLAREAIEQAGHSNALSLIFEFMTSEKPPPDLTLSIIQTPTMDLSVKLTRKAQLFSMEFHRVKLLVAEQVAFELSAYTGADCRVIRTFDSMHNPLHVLHDERECSKYVELGSGQTRSGLCCPVREAFIEEPKMFETLIRKGVCVQLEFGDPMFAMLRGTETGLQEWSWGRYNLERQPSQAEWGVLRQLSNMLE